MFRCYRTDKTCILTWERCWTFSFYSSVCYITVCFTWSYKTNSGATSCLETLLSSHWLTNLGSPDLRSIAGFLSSISGTRGFRSKSNFSCKCENLYSSDQHKTLWAINLTRGHISLSLLLRFWPFLFRKLSVPNSGLKCQSTPLKKCTFTVMKWQLEHHLFPHSSPCLPYV